LLSLGYFRSVSAAQRVEGEQAQVTFRLVEWPRVTHIRVLGNRVVDLGTILSAIGTRVGQVLCGPQLQSDIRGVEQLYRERGYVARISERLLDEAAGVGILRFEILEVAIEDVTVEGGSGALRQRAKRMLVERPPSLYRPEAVAEEKLRLMRLRGVQDAVARVEPTAPGKVRIRWVLNPGEATESR
jgi:hemolysin activation/secretion protein